jgi:hypothetical protein
MMKPDRRSRPVVVNRMAAVMCAMSLLAAVVTTVVLGESSASAAATSAVQMTPYGRPKPPPSSTSSTTTPSSTTSSSTSPTASPSSCTGSVAYGSNTYCLADIGLVRRTAYGLGVRVALGGLNVTAVNGTTVTFGGWAACAPGMICGASTWTTIVVSFAGQARLPAYGDVVTLYGVTISGSVTPDGFVVTGYCNPDFGC